MAEAVKKEEVKKGPLGKLKDAKPVADKNAIYKEFEEWIEMDDLDQDIYSLAYIGEESEYDI